jgi:isoleucyl-tRNA synthetase
VTAELAAEGLARDLIRAVQSARKDADFDVSDRIALTVTGQQQVIDAAQTHAELIKSETLTLELTLTVGDAAGGAVTVGDDLPAQVSVAKL